MNADSFLVVLQNAFSPDVLLYTCIGTLVGLIAGALPGVSAGMSMSLLLPFSIFLPPLPALGLLAGAYKGGHFGGSITSVGYGIPGESDSLVAIYDGYTMTKKGYPKKAMSTALYTSLFADMTSNVILLLVTAPLAAMAIAFGPRELFALTFLAVVFIIVFVQESPIRGTISAALGIFLGSIGTDPMVSISNRYTFGVPALLGGIDLVTFVIGLIGMNMLWEQVAHMRRRRIGVANDQDPSIEAILATHQPRKPDDKLTFREWLMCWKELGIGIMLGVIIGVIPGPGATTASFSCYGILKRFSKDGVNFGKGSIKGLVAAEGPNHATVGAKLIPLFAFGIPGSVGAAIFAAGLQMQGIAPGPTMVITHAEFLHSFLVLLIIANLINFVFAKMLIPLGAYFAKANGAILLPVLIVCNLIGAYSFMNSYVGVMFALMGATVGCLLHRWSIPTPPLIITMLVVPLMEQSFRRAEIISDGNPIYFFSSPLALSLYCLMAVLLWFAVRKRALKQEDIAAPAES